MEPEKNTGRLRDINTYFRKAFRFFDLKNERLTPVVFIVMLFAGFSSAFLPDSSTGPGLELWLYNIISLLMMYLASAVYLSAYIRELKGEEYSLGACSRLVLRYVLKVVLASAAYIAAIFSGFVLLFIPGLIIYIMFIFHLCFIIDRKKRVMEAFGASKKLTDGKKMGIFVTVLVFNLVLVLPFSIIMMLADSYNNDLIFVFVISFVGVIINLMQQRLIALMYVDLEYGVEHFEQNG